MKQFFLTVIILSSALFFTAAQEVSQPYLAPWDRSYPEQFAGDIRVKVISQAIIAPSPHNMQSWRFVLDKENPGIFKVYLDSSRLLPATDPYYRQLLMGLGVVLQYIKIAAEENSYTTDIAFFPEGEYDDTKGTVELDIKPAALVTLSPGEVKGNSYGPVMYKRVTNRLKYKKDTMKAEQAAEIEALSSSLIHVTIFSDTDNLKIIKDIIIDGVKVESSLESTMQESMDVFRASDDEKENHPFGITMGSRHTSKKKLIKMEKMVQKNRGTWKQNGKFWANKEIPALKTTPAFIMVTTGDNSRTSQIKSGMVYGMAELMAVRMGYNVQPVSQVLQEYPEIAHLYKKIHEAYGTGGRTVQMIARLGKADAVSEASIRIDVRKVIHME